MKTMINKFFRDLFSTGDAVSSKRVIAVLILINLIIFAYISTYYSVDKITPEFMYDALALLVAGGLGFTTIEKVFTSKYSNGAGTVNNEVVEEPKEEKPEDDKKEKYPKSDDLN